MATKLVDGNGDLLWSPNDFGNYSTEKIQLIANILSNLLSSTTISMETKVDESSLVNVYTKNQADNKFLDKTTLNTVVETLVDGKLSTKIENGEIVGQNSINLINARLLSLYQTCYGINFEGVTVSGNNYNSRLDSLEKSSNSNYSSLLKVLNVIYKSNPDGSISSDVKVAYASTIGELGELDPYIKDRTSVVNAINDLAGSVKKIPDTSSDVSSLKQKVMDFGNDLGSESLNTDAKTIKGAINEVLNKIPEVPENLGTRLNNNEKKIQSIDKSLGDISAISSEYISDKTNLVIILNELISKVESLESKVKTLEGAS